MTFASSAPTRQRLPGLAEHEVPETSVGSQTPDTSESSLARLRLLWMHRKMLWRVAICGVLGSALIAFLIPARYESTARLMPPDNKSSSGLALAAAAMSGTPACGIACSTSSTARRIAVGRRPALRSRIGAVMTACIAATLRRQDGLCQVSGQSPGLTLQLLETLGCEGWTYRSVIWRASPGCR